MEFRELTERLTVSGIEPPIGASELWARHATLVREWNVLASLVSQGDALKLEETHLPDSLSLAPAIVQLGRTEGHLLDIGSGGGYPAIPLKILFPGMRMTLVERSPKKVGFLRKVVGSFHLEGVEILLGEFPVVTKGIVPDLITARAVELPAKVHKTLSAEMPADSVFLCEATPSVNFSESMFHVEHWKDDWTQSGFRRGDLYLVRRKK